MVFVWTNVYQIHLPKLPITEMSSYRNVRIPKCPLIEMSVYRNVRLPKCPFTEMSVYRNVRLPKCLFTEMSVYRNVRLLKCPFTEMSIYRNVRYQTSAYSLLQVEVTRATWRLWHPLYRNWLILRSALSPPILVYSMASRSSTIENVRS